MTTKQEYIEEDEFVTLLEEDIEFTGTIKSEESTLVKGKVLNSNVNVLSYHLVVIGNGNLTGSINCDKLSIYGECEGKIRINELLVLHTSGKIQGDVQTQSLFVEEGGMFNATCKMGTPKKNS